MKSYYHFDQASLTLPKAEGVAQAVADYLNGQYAPTQQAFQETVQQVRQQLSDFFGGGQGHLTPNVKHSLRLLIRSLLQPGDTVAITQIEPPSTLRLLEQLDMKVTFLPCNDQGELLLDQAEAILCTPESQIKLVMASHASPLYGTLLPMAELGKLCHSQTIPLLVDVHLTSGRMPLSLASLEADGLYCSSDSLAGPRGLGCMILSSQLVEQVPPSKRSKIPLDAAAVYGLKAALNWWQTQDLHSLQDRELHLAGHLIARMREMEEDGLVVLGTLDRAKQIALVSVVFPDRSCHTAAQQLEEREHLTVGLGFPTSPNCYPHLSQYDNGVVCFSTGVSTSFEDVDRAHGAVCHIMFS